VGGPERRRRAFGVHHDLSMRGAPDDRHDLPSARTMSGEKFSRVVDNILCGAFERQRDEDGLVIPWILTGSLDLAGAGVSASFAYLDAPCDKSADFDFENSRGGKVDAPEFGPQSLEHLFQIRCKQRQIDPVSVARLGDFRGGNVRLEIDFWFGCMDGGRQRKNAKYSRESSPNADAAHFAARLSIARSPEGPPPVDLAAPVTLQ
jgi:hypothetical protein